MLHRNASLLISVLLEFKGGLRILILLWTAFFSLPIIISVARFLFSMHLQCVSGTLVRLVQEAAVLSTVKSF